MVVPEKLLIVLLLFTVEIVTRLLENRPHCQPHLCYIKTVAPLNFTALSVQILLVKLIKHNRNYYLKT